MKARSTALAVLVWIVTVVVVAAVTWRVIDAAGHDVLIGSPPVSPAATARQPTASASTRPSSPRPARSSQPSGGGPSRSASPQADPTASTTGGTTSGPTAGASVPPASPSSGPPATPSSSPGEPDPTAPSDPTPGGQTDTWRGAAGTVSVTCSASGVDLRGATPADGYRVEVEQDGGAIEVMFKRDEPEEDEVKVRATCPGGMPRFEVEDRRSEDSIDAEG